MSSKRISTAECAVPLAALGDAKFTRTQRKKAEKDEEKNQS